MDKTVVNILITDNLVKGFMDKTVVNNCCLGQLKQNKIKIQGFFTRIPNISTRSLIKGSQHLFNKVQITCKQRMGGKLTYEVCPSEGQLRSTVSFALLHQSLPVRVKQQMYL